MSPGMIASYAGWWIISQFFGRAPRKRFEPSPATVSGFRSAPLIRGRSFAGFSHLSQSSFVAHNHPFFVA